MNIESIVVGELQVNCYILYDDTGQGIVIDPGSNGAVILSRIRKIGLELTEIINTHGHFDHVGANGYLKNKTGASLLIHEGDRALLRQAPSSAASFGLTVEEPPEPDRFIGEREKIDFGKTTLEVIHTPGHSPGGICLLHDHVLFTGDTLFAGSIGRTDLPGGSHEQLLESIRSKLLVLAETVEIYPGHGPSSSIGREKKYNPFFS